MRVCAWWGWWLSSREAEAGRKCRCVGAWDLNLGFNELWQWTWHPLDRTPSRVAVLIGYLFSSCHFSTKSGEVVIYPSASCDWRRSSGAASCRCLALALCRRIAGLTEGRRRRHDFLGACCGRSLLLSSFYHRPSSRLGRWRRWSSRCPHRTVALEDGETKPFIG